MPANPPSIFTPPSAGSPPAAPGGVFTPAELGIQGLPNGDLVISCAKYPILNGVWKYYYETSGKKSYASPAGYPTGNIQWDTNTAGGQVEPRFSLFYTGVCSLWSPLGQDVATPDLCTGDWEEWWPDTGPLPITITADKTPYKIVVSGAGGAAANGDFQAYWWINSKRAYSKSGLDEYPLISYQSGQWRIFRSGTANDYYFATSTAATPDLATGWQAASAAPLPVPVVSMIPLGVAAPGGVFTPPSAGAPPAAPGGVFTPPSAGAPPAAPPAVFTP